MSTKFGITPFYKMVSGLEIEKRVATEARLIPRTN